MRRSANTGTVRAIVSPAPRDEWSEVASRDPEALIFQEPVWMDAMCRSGAFEDASRLFEAHDGCRIVLPLVRRRRVWPNRLAPQASMPSAWGMGGLISDRPPTVAEMRSVVEELKNLPALSTRIRPNPLQAGLWAEAVDGGVATRPGLAHVIDLEGGEEKVWLERVTKKGRQDVNAARRRGVEVERDTTGRLMPVFLDLLQMSVDRWARDQNEPLALARWRARRRDPPEKLIGMAAALGDACEVWVAWHEGRPAASIIVLRGVNASSTRGAMDKSVAGPTRATALLEWMAIESACRAGCRRYHLGESAAGSGLAASKEKFGAQAVPYLRYHFERLPLTRADEIARTGAKRLIGFRDA